MFKLTCSLYYVATKRKYFTQEFLCMLPHNLLFVCSHERVCYLSYAITIFITSVLVFVERNSFLYLCYKVYLLQKGAIIFGRFQAICNETTRKPPRHFSIPKYKSHLLQENSYFMKNS